LTVGYVADRFEGNTKRKGAAIGILSNWAANSASRSCVGCNYMV
jgi:hypothetical protein